MLTADELANLRKGGANDADILDEYKQFDPQSASDIDNLVKGGAHPKDVLDSLIEFHKGAQDSSGDKPHESDKPWYSQLGRALQYGASNTIGGIGSTARRAGYTGVADTLQQAAQATEPKDYETHGDKFKALSPSTWGQLPYAAAEGAPGMLTDIASGIAGGTLGPAGAVGGFMASNAARNLGPNVDARVGGADKPATSKDMAIAGAATAAEGLLNRVGLGPAVGSVAKGVGLDALKSAAGQVAKSTAAEGAAGVAGDVVNQAGRTAGTDGGLSINPEEALNSGAMSGAMGGALRAARVPGDVNNAVNNRDVNTEAASRLVDRMDGLKVKTNTPEEAYKAVQTTRTSLDSNINEASKTVNPFLKSKGNDTDLDQTRALLNETKSLLKNNKVVPEEQLTELGDRLGHLEEGQALHSLLQERQELNRLADQGRFEKSGEKPQGYFAGGIMSNQIAQNMLDPLTALKSKMAPAIAAGGGIAGLTAGAKLAAVAPYAGYALAGQLGLQGAASGIDRMLGNRNPAAEFMNRMRGLDQGQGPTAPSARQAQETAKAQAALQKLQASLDGSERAADVTASREDARKTSQTDKAWQLKAKQEAEAQKAADKRDAETEKAYAANGDPEALKGQQEDAMWAQRDKEQAQEPSDLEAEAGIQQGYKFLADQALKAQALRESQTTKAEKQRDRQDAQDAQATKARNRDFNKAETERNRPDPARVKAAQEEAMWKAQEDGTLPQDWSDADAIAAIKREETGRAKESESAVKQSATKALLAKKAAEKVANKAQAEGDSEPLQIKVKPKAEPEAEGMSPLKQDIMDAARKISAENGGKATVDKLKAALPQHDWSEVSKALFELQKEKQGTLSQYSDPKSLTKDIKDATVRYAPGFDDFHIFRPNKAAPKAEPQAKVKTEPKAEAPKSTESNPETVLVRHGDQTVEVSTEGKRNINAYVAKTRSRMETRAKFAKSILDEAGPRQKPYIDAMLGKLNNSADNWEQARSVIEDGILELPFNQQSHAWDMYNLHEGHLRATYDR